MAQNLKTAIFLAVSFLGGTASATSWTGQLPVYFDPEAEGRTIMCTDSWSGVEFLSAFVRYDARALRQLPCSWVPLSAVTHNVLNIQAHIEQYAGWCDIDLCVESYVTGIYQAVVHDRYLVYIIGPNPVLIDPHLMDEVREGVLPSLAYTLWEEEIPKKDIDNLPVITMVAEVE